METLEEMYLTTSDEASGPLAALQTLFGLKLGYSIFLVHQKHCQRVYKERISQIKRHCLLQILLNLSINDIEWMNSLTVSTLK